MNLGLLILKFPRPQNERVKRTKPPGSVADGGRSGLGGFGGSGGRSGGRLHSRHTCSLLSISRFFEEPCLPLFED